MTAASRPYKPSNGTEGDVFFGAWCSRCARDKVMREGANIDDPDYPKEWIVDASGPRCTAFCESWEGRPEVDTHTMDLFA